LSADKRGRKPIKPSDRFTVKPKRAENGAVLKNKNPTILSKTDTSALEIDLLRMLMESMPDHIYFKDTESRFILMSRATAELFGLSDPSTAVGKSDFDFFTEEHARKAYDDEQKIVATGRPLVAVVEKETWPDGHESWVSTTKFPLRNREGKIIGTFGISRDITEQKLAAEARIAAAALRETNVQLEKVNATLQAEIAERRRAEQALGYERNLFRTMMDSTTDNIYFKDRESRFLLINRAQASKFGLSDPSEAIGKTDFDFFTEVHARSAYNDEQRIIATGEPLEGLEELETWPDGRKTWVSSEYCNLRKLPGYHRSESD
jgi:two-component system sensor histidine kinase/response regulator